MKKPLSLIFLLVIISNLGAEERLAEGTTVFAEWSPGSWYHGTLGGRCDGDGYTILYDDGDRGCNPRNQIVLDVIPDASQLGRGVEVLALWPGNGRYYPARLGEERSGRWQVNFDDGDTGTCKADQLRIIGLQNTGSTNSAVHQKQTAPPAENPVVRQTAPASQAEPVLQRSLNVWQGGSSWAEIVESGRLWIKGSRIGEIEADGDVYVNGSREGEIESDGDIYVGGSHRGEIESDGDIWWDGSNVGSIEPDGRIWIGGSSWGEVEPSQLDYSEMRVVAGIVIFFSDAFGLSF